MFVQADDHAFAGGDTTDPALFTISFPGANRGDLYRAMEHLHIGIGANERNVHAMNDNSRLTLQLAMPLKPEWVKELSKVAAWKDLIGHLQSLVDEKGVNLFKDGKSGPSWFVDHWGVAAWNSAMRHIKDKTGRGIIILKSWKGYNESPWCKLEWLFCKCIVQRYKSNMVYVVSGTSKTEVEGYFMKGTETLK